MYQNEKIKDKTIVVWFSCGVASAVAAKKAIEIYGKDNKVIIVNTPIKEEHEDNNRFLKDVEKWIKSPIKKAINPKYPNSSIEEIFRERKYMSGIKGAPCTNILKIKARQFFETKINIDYHILGFTLEEWKRQRRFTKAERSNNIPILSYLLLTKDDCFKELKKANIEIPKIYSFGFPNANCVGCVKSSSVAYWYLVKKHFPKVFQSRDNQSREIGARLLKYKNGRYFLNEINELPIPKKVDTGSIASDIECSFFCKPELI